MIFEARWHQPETRFPPKVHIAWKDLSSTRAHHLSTQSSVTAVDASTIPTAFPLFVTDSVHPGVMRLFRRKIFEHSHF